MHQIREVYECSCPCHLSSSEGHSCCTPCLKCGVRVQVGMETQHECPADFKTEVALPSQPCPRCSGCGDDVCVTCLGLVTVAA